MPVSVGSACLTLCKRPGPLMRQQRILLSRRGTSSFGCALAWDHGEARGVHASGKVTLPRTAHPFPDGRHARAVAGAVARPDRCLSRQGPHRKKRRAGSDHADLVTTYGLMFGIGATLTGLVLTLEDDS